MDVAETQVFFYPRLLPLVRQQRVDWDKRSVSWPFWSKGTWGSYFHSANCKTFFSGRSLAA